MDLTGKGLHKGKPNLFSEIVERRRHEGDFHGVWKSRSRSTEGAGYWLQRGKAISMLVICAAVVFALIMSQRHSAPGQTSAHLPGSRGKGAYPPAMPGNAPSPSKGLIAGTGPRAESGEGLAAAPGSGASDGTDGSKASSAGPGPAAGRSEPGAGEAGPDEEIVRGDGAFVFRPVLPEFKPLQELDLRFIEDRTWDDFKWPAESNQIKKEADVVAHIFRYLRTHGADLRLRAHPDMTHGDMMRQPTECRGKAFDLRVKLIKKYMNFGWPKNDSGVQDTSMLFCYPVNAVHGRAIFVILVPQPLEDFREEEIYDLTGVFWKRYPYVNSSNAWQWQPLVLTMHMTPASPPPADSARVTVAIIVAAAVLILGMLFLVRGETREGQAKRAARIERRRRQQQTKPASTRRGGLAPLQPAGDPHDHDNDELPQSPPPDAQPPAGDDKPDDFQVKLDD